jgi:peptidoglycan/LPS O-acetylase OafA/YrhL
VAAGVPGPGRRVPVFDGVRGVAILSVIAYHTAGLPGSTAGLDRLIQRGTGAGWLGVDLFFVLSGFLITGILIETKGEEGFFKSFYARRTLRIFPLYYAVVVVAVLLVPLAFAVGIGPDKYEHYAHDLWHKQLWLWTYTQNYLQAGGAHELPGLGHLWSLAVEEQFYLAWPLVVFVTPRRRLLSTALTICVMVTILRVALALSHTVDPLALRQWTFTRVDTLLLGGVAAIIVRTPNAWDRVRRYLRPTMRTCIALLLVGSSLHGVLQLDDRFSAVFVYSIAAVGAAAWMIRLCEVPSPFLLKGWLRQFGFYSYAIYVFHWPISQVVESGVRRSGVAGALTGGGSQIAVGVLQFSLVTAASFVAALISWRLWEQRWLRLKSRFSYAAEPASD